MANIDEVKDGEFVEVDEDVDVADTADVAPGGEIPPTSTSSAPTSRDITTLPIARSYNQSIQYVPANLEGLMRRQPNMTRSLVKSRQGRGGNVKYTGWTNTADLFDLTFGPGQWGLTLDRIETYERLQNNEMMCEYITFCTFDAAGMFKPITVIGSHDYQYKDNTAHRSDAIESAMSKALSKAGARVSMLLRSVWGKDDAAMQEIQSPDASAVNAIAMMIASIMEMAENRVAKVKEVNNVFKVYRLQFTGKEGTPELINKLKTTTGAELAKMGSDLADLL
jgi:hypothetical protein